jgi:hypothetical protein
MTPTNVTPAPVKTDWSELKGKLRTKFTILTDADVNFEESNKEEMLTGIQKKIGKSREELTAIIFAL